MKLSKTAAAGIVIAFAGAVIVAIYALLPQSQLNYVNVKLDVATLARLNMNFKRLVLTSQLQTAVGRDKVTLTPYIEVTAGLPTGYSNLLGIYSGSVAFASDKPMSSYEISKQQIDSLLSIPRVAYFVLKPVLYPADNKYIAYRAVAYNFSNIPIPIDAVYQQFNPCPPARAYAQ